MRGLLSVSFGTSHADARIKAIDAIDATLARAFPDRALYTAWTSSRIIGRVLSERGERHDTLAQAFSRMSADGVDDLLVATTCFVQGGEMQKVIGAVGEWLAAGNRTARVAAPLLASPGDCRAVARAVASEFSDVPGTDAVLLMGHGSRLGVSQPYRDVQGELHALGKDRFFVATVEGSPAFHDALALIERCGARRVVLAPLMMVAGDHARNDMAGGNGSWAGLLEQRGFSVEPIMKGLGEYPAVQQLVVEHALMASPYPDSALR